MNWSVDNDVFRWIQAISCEYTPYLYGSTTGMDSVVLTGLNGHLEFAPHPIGTISTKQIVPRYTLPVLQNATSYVTFLVWNATSGVVLLAEAILLRLLLH